MAELAAADAGGAARQGRAGRFLDLFLHQLPARASLRPRLGREVQGPGPGRDRRARAGIRLREEPRQCAQRGRAISRSTIRSRSTTTTRSGAPSTTSTGRRTTSSMRKGRIRHHHFGEGDYDESERVIQQLLAEAGQHRRRRRRRDGQRRRAPRPPPTRPTSQSPETYVGYERAENFVSPGGAVQDARHVYARRRRRRLNQWAPRRRTGRSADEQAVLDAQGGSIVFRFHARDLHLVLGPAADGKPVRFRVPIDGAAARRRATAPTSTPTAHGIVTDQRLYQLIRQNGADRRPHLRDRVPRSRRAGLSPSPSADWETSHDRT